MISQDDPLAEFRVNRQKQDVDPVQQKQAISSDDPLAEFRVKQAEGFPFVKEVGRHATRIGSRIAETIGGIPGDISSLIQSGIFSGIEKFSGKKVPEEVRERTKKDRLPTSHELKELSESYTKGFTSAQGPTEKAIDEFAETVTGLLGPMKFRKALGIGLGSTAAKKGLETLGIGEGGQEAGKLGTMFLLSTINPKGALKYSNSQYEKANQLARGASIKSSGLENSLKSLSQALEEGLTTQKKTSVKNPARELLGKINNGKIKVSELTAAKRDINDLIGEPQTLKGARKLLGSLGKMVDNAIKPYEKINPEFSKVYRPANEIYGAIQQGNKASNFMKSVLGTKSILGATLAEAALGHPEYIIPTAAGATAALGSARTVDFFTRLGKSKELRKFYGKALTAAAKEDAPALRLYADKIEQLMQTD